MIDKLLLQLLINGLIVGALYGVVAMSFVLIYKASQVVNFAQGEFLLIGAWELSRRVEIPYRVVINESVELAKSFGGTDGHRYVNGVLDRFAADVRAVEIAAGKRDAAPG